MRRTTSALLLSALVATLVPGAALVAGPASASTESAPVAPQVVELAVSGIDPQAASDPADRAYVTTGETRRTVLLTAREATADYGLVGVTWRPDPAVTGVEAFARTRVDGVWSAWEALGGLADEAPDADHAEALDGLRAGTAPLWVGQADGVQVRVDVVSGADPRDLRVALVDPGASTADAAVAEPRAYARTAGVPAIRSRAEWGADESIRRSTPSYASALRAVVVHHTASSNDYAPADVPRLLRGFYAYHVKSNGWSDLGYNVVVDRFGTAWEGRAGGLERAVIGSHAGGFNTGTTGVSVIGTYESVSMSAAALETVAQVAAWKLGAAGVDPKATVTMTSGGGTKWPAGTSVTLPTVMGHRQVSSTSCPGTRGFAALPGLRDRTAALVGGAAPTAGGLQLIAPSSVTSGGTAKVSVRGGTPGSRVKVLFRKRGEQQFTVRRDAVLSDAGAYATSFVVDDDYALLALSDGKATPPFTVRRSPAATTAVSSAAPALSVVGPVTAVVGSTAVVTATGPVGAAVSVYFRREGDAEFVSRRSGVFDAAGRFTTTYAADRPHDYFAATSGSASNVTTTLVGPVPNGLHVYAPDSTPHGGTVPLVVQGTPGAGVDLWFLRRGEVAFTKRRVGVLGADGTYRTSYVATDDQVYFAAGSTRTSTREQTRVTSAPSTLPPPPAPKVGLTAPAKVDAGAAVPVSLTGSAGAPVQLWVRKRGAAVYSLVRNAQLDSAGRYATTLAGSDDHELWAASGNGASVDAETLAMPVLSTPSTAFLGTKVTLSGRARPGDSVVLERLRRGATTPSRVTVTADATGVFRSAYGVDDEYEHRPVVGARVGALRLTRVAPTGTGVSAAARGSRVALTGTARPGATVQVWFRNHSQVTAGVGGRMRRDLGLRLGRTLTADAAGRWSTSFLLSATHTWRATADGTATPVRTVTPR